MFYGFPAHFAVGLPGRLKRVGRLPMLAPIAGVAGSVRKRKEGPHTRRDGTPPQKKTVHTALLCHQGIQSKVCPRKDSHTNKNKVMRK